MEFTYLQAILTGFIQGITELFPISSLGHAVLVPAWVGGPWGAFTTDPDSPYLAITVALHLASAFALFLVFRKRWIRLIAFGAKRAIGIKSVPGDVFWKVVIGTIPVVVLALLFESKLRNVFASPLAASVFLTLNGLVLVLAERLTRRTNFLDSDKDSDGQIQEHVSYKDAVVVGFGQSLALFSGISRFGITMSFGLFRKMSHSAASDFAFLLALPVIAGASVKKLPDLFASQYSDLLGPILVGSCVSFIATYISVSFLVKWFKTNTLYPFAIYCLVAGSISVVKFWGA